MFSHHSVYDKRIIRCSPGRLTYILWLLYGLNSCALYVFSPFGVSTFMLTRVSNGLAEATGAWAVGPVFAVESTGTTSQQAAPADFLISPCWSGGSLVIAGQVPWGLSRLLICASSSCHFTLDTLPLIFIQRRIKWSVSIVQ